MPMTVQQSEFGYRRFSTEPSRLLADRSAYLDLLRRMIFEMDVADDELVVDSAVMKLPGLGVIHSRAGAFRTIRTRAMAEGSDDRILMICLEGVAHVSHLDREETLHSGSAILLSSADALRIDRSISRHIVVTIPRTILSPTLVGPDVGLMVPMDAASDAFRLLRGYLGLLAADPGFASSALGSVAAAHVHDLVAVAVGATRDARDAASDRGVRAARLKAVTADIDANLAGDVSGDALARRHRISPRYVRKLFEGEGTSLSQYVLGCRLARVHRRLSDPREAHLTIGGIAYDAGFDDLSTFNRSFRRHFGLAPSDVRGGRKAR